MYGDLRGKEHPFWTKIKAREKAKKLGLDTTFLDKLIKKEGKEIMNRIGPLIKEIENGKISL